MGINKVEISRVISNLTDLKRSKMKAVLQAIEELFPNIAIVCVDKKKDVVLFGFNYLDQQEEAEENGGVY